MFNLIAKSLLAGLLVAAVPVSAKTTTGGTVTFIGTLSQLKVGDNYYSRFRVRLTDSTCDGVKVDTRWITVESGRGDGVYVHNMATLDNAYGTLVAAQLSGKRVQIGGLSSCDAASTQTIQLWDSDIGMY